MVSYRVSRAARRPVRGRARSRAGEPGSRDRLLSAAAAEFAARGFDGAKVDRIAARARLNKAMLYYHFHDKAALYRAVLAGVFDALAAEVEAARQGATTPAAQLQAFIRTVATLAVRQPQFPAIWLRELAEGGRHLDASTVGRMKDIVGTLAALLAWGVERGEFRPANPFVTQLSIVGPLVMFAASAPLRARFRGVVPAAVSDTPLTAVVAQVEANVLAALTLPPSAPSRAPEPAARPSRSSPS
jgi:AcrR family transcriptional regulator